MTLDESGVWSWPHVVVHELLDRWIPIDNFAWVVLGLKGPRWHINFMGSLVHSTRFTHLIYRMMGESIWSNLSIYGRYDIISAPQSKQIGNPSETSRLCNMKQNWSAAFAILVFPIYSHRSVSKKHTRGFEACKNLDISTVSMGKTGSRPRWTSTFLEGLPGFVHSRSPAGWRILR